MFNISKVSKGLGVLRRIWELLPIDSLNQIYKSITQPHFDYCSPVRHSCDKGLRTKLQRLQDRAARIFTRSGYKVRSADLRNDLRWQPLGDRWYQQKVTTMYEIAPHSRARNFTSSQRVKFFLLLWRPKILKIVDFLCFKVVKLQVLHIRVDFIENRK